ncbi:Membrane-spanning 4-domains subfamily A member 14 [Lemmus lemmus]
MESPSEDKRRSHVITIDPNETILTAFPYRPHNSLLDLLKGEPKVLGAIQILLSLVTVGLGIILAFNFIFFSKKFPLVILTGYTFWGAFIFFLAGFITVFNDKLRQNLRQEVTIMNILSSLAALAGIVLILISFTQQHKFCQTPSIEGPCVVGRTLLLGILSVLLIITIVEFSISLTIASLRSRCWTSSRKAVFFFPSEVPQNSEQPVPEENNQLQFEFQGKSLSDNTASNIKTIFLGGYAFFKLRVSRNPSAPKYISQKSDKGTSSMHVPNEQENISPPSLEEETKLDSLPPPLTPKSSENIPSQKESRNNNLNDEDLESITRQTSDLQPKLIDNQNMSLKFLKTPSSQNFFPLLPDSLSSQTLMAALSTQVLQSIPPSSCISQSYDLTSEVLPSKDIPFQETPSQDMQFQDTLTQDISSQETQSQDTSYQDTLTQDIPSQETSSQMTQFQETPNQDTLTLDIPSQSTQCEETPSQEIPSQETLSHDMQSQDVLSPEKLSQSTQTQDIVAHDMSFSDLQALNTQVQIQQDPEIFYRDIRTEVMELTQEWKSNMMKKTPRRLSLSLPGKHGKFPPKRYSLDLQIKSDEAPRRHSVDLQRKTSRRKSIDQQIKALLSPKKHTIEKQDAYTQTTELFLHEPQAKEEEVPAQPQDEQSKDQKYVEELYPGEQLNGKKKDQQSDKEQRPEEQVQPAEDQQPLEQKSPKSQSPNWQERQQELVRRSPMLSCVDWDSQSFQFTERSCSYWSTPSWQPVSLGSQDWRSQGWRNKDWKAQEWQFEIQPSLDWESQELLERESLRQRALYQEIQPRTTIVQHTQDRQLCNIVFHVGLCQSNDQQDSESGVLRGDMYAADDVQTRDREFQDIEDTCEKPKDQQSEDIRPDNYPVSCQSLVPYTYVTCLSNIASEQEVQNNMPCSNSSKDLNATSSSWYQKDQQQSEDSD